MDRKNKPKSPTDMSTATTADVAAVGFLLVAALVLSWPVITDGYLTYADNPVHLAEIYSLADEQFQGWSDIGFCGFPIGTLHSPFWYKTMGALVWIGVPGGLLYALMLFAGFVATPLALYAVARRGLGPVMAGLLAYFLLIQRPSLVGLGSPLAGMWTYYLAAALWLLLVPRLIEPVRTRRDLVWIAVLSGLILSTHLFVIVPLAVLGAIHVGFSLWKRTRPKELLLQAAAVFAGILAAASYWAPMALSAESVVFAPQNLAPQMVFARLFLPTDIIELVKGELPAITTRLVVDAIPMCILIAAGFTVLFWHRKRAAAVPLYGLAAALIVLVLVAFVAPASNARLFGPVSWRLVYFVRLGLALGAIPLLMVVEKRFNACARGWAAWAIGVVCVALTMWWSEPLRDDAPAGDSAEMTEVRGLWAWLAENKREEWGRVYLQDTFMTPPRSSGLWRSHILTLTAHKTGVRQLGPYYGVVPFETNGWTMSQVGLLYGMRVSRDQHVSELETRMRLSNATHLVTSDPAAAARIHRTGVFDRLAEVGRFTVFATKDGAFGWVEPIEGRATVTIDRYDTGRIDANVKLVDTGASILAKVSYHPFWHLENGGDTHLGMGSWGLLRVEGLSRGEHKLSLKYNPPIWPHIVSLLGWLAILVVAVSPGLVNIISLPQRE
ncbi:MAG: hypothetical protein JSW50_03360 [Candidatus Latescibacterota bacterium]|nr:MAG: hypothetical protein JSW50_03360 [Candidatus Latescibacterota bacterium]